MICRSSSAGIWPQGGPTPPVDAELAVKESGGQLSPPRNLMCLRAVNWRRLTRSLYAPASRAGVFLL